jgi:hypothetical protein
MDKTEKAKLSEESEIAMPAGRKQAPRIKNFLKFICCSPSAFFLFCMMRWTMNPRIMKEAASERLLV